MFDALPPSKPDAILALMTAFREDTRAHKLDLGVGVYKDANGVTPVMQAVSEAELRVHAQQTTKSYVSPLGDPEFVDAMIQLVLGDSVTADRVRGGQAVGGSGALRILAGLMREAAPSARVWLPDPTWPNHVPLLASVGMEQLRYPYYNSAASQVDFDAMQAALKDAKAGDIVVLHGCCHNPTGADLSLEQWRSIGQQCNEQGLMPFVDLAYQGFGLGLEPDTAGTRELVQHVPEAVIAASCSKNFGLYRERTGAAILVGESNASVELAKANLSTMVRKLYSMPPDHGARVVHTVLTDAALKQQWTEELESMRQRMVRLRGEFADALRQRSNSDRFDALATQQGMFSRLPLNPEHIDRLRDDKGLYLVGDGRINVAGLPETGMDELADAIVSVMS